MLKILGLSFFNLGRASSGASVRARGIFELLGRIGKVGVVFASPYEDDLSDPALPIPGLELLDVMQFRPTGKKSVRERLRHEFDPRFLDAFGYRALPADLQRLQKLMREYDLVWVHGLPVANGFGLWRWPNSVLDIDDVPSLVWHRAFTQSRYSEKLPHLRQALIWRRRERALLQRFDAICVCTEEDRADLEKRLGGQRRIFILPNAFSKPERPPQRRPAEPARIGFIGNLKHLPNRQGLAWFVHRVWPRILKAAPDVTLRIIGIGSESEDWGGAMNIESLGWVEDPADEMATWALTVVPVFEGGGTRIKTAEAFSRKCPIVSTSFGVAGYDVADGNEVLIANSADDFSTKCLRLVQNPALAVSLAECAWNKFVKHWTWDSHADRVRQVVNYVCQPNGGSVTQSELMGCATANVQSS